MRTRDRFKTSNLFKFPLKGASLREATLMGHFHRAQYAKHGPRQPEFPVGSHANSTDQLKVRQFRHGWPRRAAIGRRQFWYPTFHGLTTTTIPAQSDLFSLKVRCSSESMGGRAKAGEAPALYRWSPDPEKGRFEGLFKQQPFLSWSP